MKENSFYLTITNLLNYFNFLTQTLIFIHHVGLMYTNFIIPKPKFNRKMCAMKEQLSKLFHKVLPGAVKVWQPCDQVTHGNSECFFLVDATITLNK